VPIFRLDERLIFPPAELADPDGIVAVGGDLRPERLLAAYAAGIFPWYHEGIPILWHSPDPRMVLPVADLRIPRSTRRFLRQRKFEVRLDTAFAEVISRCADDPRPDQDGTWITDEMRDAYIQLHELGFAHSAEAWRGRELMGGLYGVAIGGMFFGESMFTSAPEASKVAFAQLTSQLSNWGIDLVDCQVHTEHLERFGATNWPRSKYLEALAERITLTTHKGKWELEPEFLT